MKMHQNRMLRICGRGLLGSALLVVSLACAGETRQRDGVTEAVLRSLCYGDNLPGFHETSVVRNVKGASVEMNLPDKDGTTASRIQERWLSNDDLNEVEVELTVFASPELAMSAGQSIAPGGAEPAFVMPVGSRIGDKSWIRSSPTDADKPIDEASGKKISGAGRAFVLGRTFVRMSISQYNSFDDVQRGVRRFSELDGHYSEIADTLARGVEWAIRQHPELLSQTDMMERQVFHATGKSMSDASTLTYRGITWGSLSGLEQAGAKVNWDKKKNLATVTYQGHKLEVRPFHRDANLDGHKVDLGATVMVAIEGPVVPMRRVADHLGIKLEFTKVPVVKP